MPEIPSGSGLVHAVEPLRNRGGLCRGTRLRKLPEKAFRPLASRGNVVRTTPPLRMPTFLTVKEAATLVGKSPSSIRRIIYPILEQDDHPDRIHIQPAPDEVVQLRLKGENFAWRVSEELLHREVPPETAGSGPQPKPGGTGESGFTGELIAMLRTELGMKNEQITQQMDMNKSLHERLRESNILIGSLQRQLSLPAGKPPEDATFVDQPKTAAPAKSRPTPAPKAQGKKSKGKRGILARWFSR